MFLFNSISHFFMALPVVDPFALFLLHKEQSAEGCDASKAEQDCYSREHKKTNLIFPLTLFSALKRCTAESLLQNCQRPEASQM